MAGKKTNAYRVPKDATLLAKVSSLTLRQNKKTTARRLDPVPQLECIGPKHVCKLHNIGVMRCTNEGADYDADNIQWSCKASLPEDFKLGSTDVICEGYESSDDPYVLKGSCGVEYRLMLTDKGEQKYGSHYADDESESSASSASTVVFFLFFAVILFIILKGLWSAWHQNPPRLGGNRPNRGDGGNDPPPPYDDHPSYYDRPRKPKTQQASPRTAPSSRASSSRGAPQRAQQEGWRPGFWSGTAAGAAAGYLAGSRSQARNSTASNGSARQAEAQQQPGGFWSSLGTSQRGASAPVTVQPSDTSRDSSAVHHESTGFGETRRR